MQITLELAKLYMKTEDFESCEHQCMTMLRTDKEIDSANVVSVVNCGVDPNDFLTCNWLWFH